MSPAWACFSYDGTMTDIEYFHDRRSRAHEPNEADYEAPLDKDGVADANRRFKATGVPGVITARNRGMADNIVKETSRFRHRARRAEGKDFRNVGEYLEFLNSIPEE